MAIRSLKVLRVVDIILAQIGRVKNNSEHSSQETHLHPNTQIILASNKNYLEHYKETIIFSEINTDIVIPEINNKNMTLYDNTEENKTENHKIIDNKSMKNQINHTKEQVINTSIDSPKDLTNEEKVERNQIVKRKNNNKEYFEQKIIEEYKGPTKRLLINNCENQTKQTKGPVKILNNSEISLKPSHHSSNDENNNHLKDSTVTTNNSELPISFDKNLQTGYGGEILVIDLVLPAGNKDKTTTSKPIQNLDNEPALKNKNTSKIKNSTNNEEEDNIHTDKENNNLHCNRKNTKSNIIKIAKSLDSFNFRVNIKNLVKILEIADKEFEDNNIKAMFIAQLAHESGGFNYLEEESCIKNDCSKLYGKGAPNKSYHGRGFIQLTWPSNYRKASKYLSLGNKLYFEPELVSNDIKIAIDVSVWYWKEVVQKHPLFNKEKFGTTTMAINGKIECINSSTFNLVNRRYKIYSAVAKAMGITQLALEEGCL